MNKQYIFLSIFFSVLLCSYFYFSLQHKRYSDVLSFDDCIKAGYTLLPTYPERCVMPGKTFIQESQRGRQQVLGEATTSERGVPPLPDYKNLTYIVEGSSIPFRDGYGVLAPTTRFNQSTSTLHILDTIESVQINKDGVPDRLLIIVATEKNTKNRSYYTALALSLSNGYVGTNAIYIGSNIASTTYTYIDNKIIVRLVSEDGVMVTKHFVFENNLLREVLLPH